MTASDPERERWDLLEVFLHALEEIPEGERKAYLARECPDPELRQRVLRLLADEAKSSGWLEGLFEELAPRHGEWPDLTSRRVGAYRLLRPLGRGGMGVVYEAERVDGAFEQRVALKLLAMALAGSEAHDRFLVERRVLATLGHPAIAHIMDGGVADDGTPWFAMEYVEGEPLDVHCDRRWLGIHERLELFLQVCDAVEHAHRRLVVHRDLKPANVLVTEAGQVKLLDFGIAKLLDAENMGAVVPPTRTALRLMTPEYASPEQVRGEAVTTASDVYQLGLLLYDLLCGHRPYGLPDRRVGELERAICERVPTRPSVAVGREEGVKEDAAVEELCRARSTTLARLRRRLRGDLDNVVLKALSKEPERRYGSADRLAEDIRRYLSGLPVTARADTWAYRGRRFLERHAVGATAAAGVIVLAAGMMGFHTTRVQRERDRAQAEAAKARQMSQFLTGMLRSADPREARGRELTARELLDRGVEQAERELADQPDIQASMLHILGRTYLELGLFDSAERFLTRALDLRRSQRGPEHPEIAKVLGDLGLLRYREGAYDRARELLEDAVPILAAMPAGDAPALADVLETLGQTYRRLGDYDRGLETLERALSIQRQTWGKNSEPAAAALNGLGTLFFDTGEYERAEDHFERALAIQERELGPDHPQIAWALMNLAIARTRRGELEGVEPMHRRALAILRNAYGAVHPTVGTALNNLGYYLVESGRNEEAIEVLQDAVEVSRATLGQRHPRVAYPLGSLGDAYLAGGHLHEARTAYQRSVALRENALEEGRFDPVLANGLWGLARIELEQGDPTTAERFLRRARAIWATTPESEPAGLVPILVDLGRLLVDQRRCADAVPLLRRALRLQSSQQSEASAEIAELEGLLAVCS